MAYNVANNSRKSNLFNIDRQWYLWETESIGQNMLWKTGFLSIKSAMPLVTMPTDLLMNRLIYGCSIDQ